MHAELNMACAEQFGMLPDCNCPHEHWHIGQARFCLDLHFEDDGSCHVLLMDDDGDEYSNLIAALAPFTKGQNDG